MAARKLKPIAKPHVTLGQRGKKLLWRVVFGYFLIVAWANISEYVLTKGYRTSSLNRRYQPIFQDSSRSRSSTDTTELSQAPSQKIKTDVYMGGFSTTASEDKAATDNLPNSTTPPPVPDQSVSTSQAQSSAPSNMDRSVRLVGASEAGKSDTYIGGFNAASINSGALSEPGSQPKVDFLTPAQVNDQQTSAPNNAEAPTPKTYIGSFSSPKPVPAVSPNGN